MPKSSQRVSEITPARYIITAPHDIVGDLVAMQLFHFFKENQQGKKSETFVSQYDIDLT